MPSPGLSLETLDYRVAHLERNEARSIAATETLVLLGATMASTKDTMEKLGHWIETVDTRVRAVEIDHPRDLNTRVKALEVAAPMLELTSYWVRVGVLGVLSLVGMAAWTILFPTV